MYKLIAIIVLVLLPYTNVSSKMDGDAQLLLNRLPNKIAQCAAIYDLLAEMERAIGNTNSSENYNDFGNGAEVSSWIMYIMNGSPQEIAVPAAQERRRVHLVYLKAMIERNQSEEIVEITKKCNDIYFPLQENLVEAMQTYAYGGLKDDEKWFSMMLGAWEKWMSGLTSDQFIDLYSE